MGSRQPDKQPKQEASEQTPKPPEVKAEMSVDTAAALRDIFDVQAERVREEAASFRSESQDAVAEVAIRYNAPPTAPEQYELAQLIADSKLSEIVHQQQSEAVMESSVETSPEAKKRPSLWETARAWVAANQDKIRQIKEGRVPKEGQPKAEIVVKYGKSAVDSKFKRCDGPGRAECADAYVARLKAAGREVPSDEELQRALELIMVIVDTKQLPDVGREYTIVQEMAQELAYADYQAKVEGGESSLGAEGIAADMMQELDLGEKAEIVVESIEQAREAVAAELKEYVDKGYITEKEMKLIAETVSKFGEVYMSAFEGYKFPGKETMEKEQVVQQSYELMRDNARKIVFQTKLDKRAFAGSDHGTRHICEGCTHASEQLMGSLKGLEGVDFKPQDEVLVRQIIIDHDIGYTTDAAQAKEGHEASKDHPCAGCQFVEKNKDYYVDKFGEEGFQVIRDVVLNHSYPQAEYKGQRPKANDIDGEITYNRDLIRSVVSTVDALGVTSETKAMDMFRRADAVDLLQTVQLYSETHGGKVDDAAMAEFKQDFNRLIDQWLNKDKSISEERAKGYRQAVENHFSAFTVEVTLGQFTGIVREIKMVAGKQTKDGVQQKDVVPEIRMDVSRLAALVGDNFGDKAALRGFVKAMEDFGLTTDDLQKLAKTVKELRAETDPAKRAQIIREQLTFESDRATFIVGESETTGLPDEREGELEAIRERFKAFDEATIRSELRLEFRALLEVKPENRTEDTVFLLIDGIERLSDRDEAEDEKIIQLSDSLLRHLRDDKELKKLEPAIYAFKSKVEKEKLKKYEEAGKK